MRYDYYGILPLEVKEEKFGNRDDGTWQKHNKLCHNMIILRCTLTYISGIVSQTVEAFTVMKNVWKIVAISFSVFLEATKDFGL